MPEGGPGEVMLMEIKLRNYYRVYSCPRQSTCTFILVHMYMGPTTARQELSPTAALCGPRCRRVLMPLVAIIFPYLIARFPGPSHTLPSSYISDAETLKQATKKEA
jgi:hypothetical protein